MQLRISNMSLYGRNPLREKCYLSHKFQSMYFLLPVLLLMLRIFLHKKHYIFGKYITIGLSTRNCYLVTHWRWKLRHFYEATVTLQRQLRQIYHTVFTALEPNCWKIVKSRSSSKRVKCYQRHNNRNIYFMIVKLQPSIDIQQITFQLLLGTLSSIQFKYKPNI